MSNYITLKQELKNKERNIEDLIRFINTKTDNNPNYSLLLGAGCSISSGVRPATTLIEEWKKEIFNQGEDIQNNESIDSYFDKQLWFDSRNPYSSLFERRFDLPRQRRMFVEKEVRDKTPSIGYAYLTKLVESKFFNTIFTTNFDDLLNEAFYQYSIERPIICAHDSSINSITVTSKRPKIIKLHGDYLFDDIKSTLRETESLEENIKNKFIEFSKDYGLIVIGYGGNDRSIMDILNYLLKNEDYFKNGIYWCLLESTEINEDLRKLLWKDRVYYVKIEGFDELFAEINAKINNGSLPIENSLLNNNVQNTLETIINNKSLTNTKSEYISNDINKLKNTINKDIISNFFNYLSKNEIDKNINNEFSLKTYSDISFTAKEKEILKLIDKEIFTSNFNYALEITNKHIKNTLDNNPYLIKLLQIKIRCTKKLNLNKEEIETHKKLLSIDSIFIKSYIRLSDLHSDINIKLEYIDKAIEIDPFYCELYNIKSKILFNYYQDGLKPLNQLNYSLNDMLELLDKSIEIDPSIMNSAWYIKSIILRDKYKNDTEYADKSQIILDTYKKQDLYHPNIIKLECNLAKINNKPNEYIYNIIINAIDNTLNLDFKKENEFHLLIQYSNNKNNNLLNERFLTIENNYNIDTDYLLLKSKLTLKSFNNIEKSISILENISIKNTDVYTYLIELYLFTNQIEQAENIFKNNLIHNKITQALIHEYKSEYNKSLEIYNTILDEENSCNIETIIQITFLHLKAKDYSKALSISKKYLTENNYNHPVLLINKFLAEKKLNTLKFNKVEEKFLKTKEHKKLHKAAAYALINNLSEAKKLIVELIKEDYSNLYFMPNMVVFDEIDFNEIESLVH